MFFNKKKNINRVNEFYTSEDLEIISAVSASVLSNLSLDDLLQDSIDQIVKRYKFLGGLLFIVDNNHLYAKTIAGGKTASRFLTLIGKPISELHIELKKDYNNYVVNSILNKEISFSYNLDDFTRNVLSEKLANSAAFLTQTRACIAIPIVYKDEVLGGLFFSKSRKEDFAYELPMMKLVSTQIGIAIVNAKLFKDTTVQLDQLAAKNQELQSLYSLTSNVSKTLDPDQVTQIAVDSLPQDTFIIGGILTTLDSVSQKLYIRAITRNNLSAKAEEIMGGFSKYVVDVTDPKNQNMTGVKVVKSQNIETTDSLAEALSPTVPEAIVFAIEKIFKVSSIVCFPIIYRGELRGVMAYLLKDKKYAVLSRNEKQLLETLTYQISIALENSLLFKETQSSQSHTEVALNQVQTARKHEQDMVDILGHELRTPATVCRGNLELLLSMMKSVNPQTEFEQKITAKVNSAYMAIQQEVGLISELLTATKLDSGQLVITNEIIDLDLLTKTAYNNYITAAQKKSLTFSMQEPATPLPKTIGDPVRIGEVIDNFTSNAIKYTQKGFVKITLEYDDKNIYFHISDSGNGVSQENVATLFQKFHRLNNYISNSKDINRPGGTGLGLYVAKGIVEAHSGRVWVESAGEGQGSTFSFSIPVRSLIKSVEPVAAEEMDMFKKLNLKKVT